MTNLSESKEIIINVPVGREPQILLVKRDGKPLWCNWLSL
jgi:hypothetical protein